MNAAKVKFGDFELDVAAYQLTHCGRPVKLERIPMELLLLLLDGRGRLVTRDEILEKVWGKEVFLDIDNSINTAISKIRVALKDDPEKPAFIKTVSGKGYRFVAPNWMEKMPLPPPATVFKPRRRRLRPWAHPNLSPRPLFRFRRPWPGLVIIAILAAALSAWSWRDSLSRIVVPNRVPVIRAIAVLPLENLTGDPSQEYFADGMSDALITDLAQRGAKPSPS